MSSRRLFVTALAASLLAGAAGVAAQTTIKVGVTAGPPAQIMEAVKAVAAKNGLTIQIVEFTDFIIPNTALDAGEIQANAFQHQPYLDNQKTDRKFKIDSVGQTYTVPLGIYSKKHKTWADVPSGASIAIPNDPTNGGRALLLLQAKGAIKLKPNVGLKPTPLDIVDNPKKAQDHRDRRGADLALARRRRGRRDQHQLRRAGRPRPGQGRHPAGRPAGPLCEHHRRAHGRQGPALGEDPGRELPLARGQGLHGREVQELPDVVVGEGRGAASGAGARAGATALVLLLLATSALAQQLRDQQWTWCIGDPGISPDQTIAGCTVRIVSGIETTQNLAIAYDNRGIAYGLKGQFDRAIQDHDQAIRLDPSYAKAFLNRGDAYDSKGQYVRALEDYDQAIRLDPSNANAWNNRCLTRTIVGQLDQALADCNESLRLIPDDPDHLDSRDLVHLMASRLDAAIVDYDVGAALGPEARARARWPRHCAPAQGRRRRSPPTSPPRSRSRPISPGRWRSTA